MSVVSRRSTLNSGLTLDASLRPSSITNAINSLSSNVSLSAEEKRKVIEDEAKTLESFKVRVNIQYRQVGNVFD